MIYTGCLGNLKVYVHFAALNLLAPHYIEELLVNCPAVRRIGFGKPLQVNVVFIQSSHQTNFSGHKDKTIFSLIEMIKVFFGNLSGDFDVEGGAFVQFGMGNVDFAFVILGHYALGQ